MSLPDPIIQWWLDSGGEVNQRGYFSYFTASDEQLEKFLTKITTESVLAGVRLAKQKMNNALSQMKTEQVDNHGT